MMGALTIRSSTAWASGESEAVWKQSLYKRRPYVICGARLRTDILDNRSLAMLLEISKGLIYQTLVSGQPLRARRTAQRQADCERISNIRSTRSALSPIRKHACLTAVYNVLCTYPDRT